MPPATMVVMWWWVFWVVRWAARISRWEGVALRKLMGVLVRMSSMAASKAVWSGWGVGMWSWVPWMRGRKRAVMVRSKVMEE